MVCLSVFSCHELIYLSTLNLNTPFPPLPYNSQRQKSKPKVLSSTISHPKCHLPFLEWRKFPFISTQRKHKRKKSEFLPLITTTLLSLISLFFSAANYTIFQDYCFKNLFQVQHFFLLFSPAVKWVLKMRKRKLE